MILFSAILALGVSLSAVHIHSIDIHDEEALHQIIENDHICLLCGSVIKFIPIGQFEILDRTNPVLSSIVHTTEFVPATFFYYRSDRAPPFSLSV